MLMIAVAFILIALVIWAIAHGWSSIVESRRLERERERELAWLSRSPTIVTKPFRLSIPTRAYQPAPRNAAYRDRQHDDGGLLTSMLIAETTDSPVLGMLAGGNVSGALIGGMISESSHHHSDDSFSGGGGASAGGGASSSWSDSSSSSSSDTSSSDSCSSSSYDSGSSCSDSGSSW